MNEFVHHGSNDGSILFLFAGVNVAEDYMVNQKNKLLRASIKTLDIGGALTLEATYTRK